MSALDAVYANTSRRKCRKPGFSLRTEASKLQALGKEILSERVQNDAIFENTWTFESFTAAVRELSTRLGGTNPWVVARVYNQFVEISTARGASKQGYGTYEDLQFMLNFIKSSTLSEGFKAHWVENLTFFKDPKGGISVPALAPVNVDRGIPAITINVPQIVRHEEAVATPSFGLTALSSIPTSTALTLEPAKAASKSRVAYYDTPQVANLNVYEVQVGAKRWIKAITEGSEKHEKALVDFFMTVNTEELGTTAEEMKDIISLFAVLDGKARYELCFTSGENVDFWTGVAERLRSKERRAANAIEFCSYRDRYAINSYKAVSGEYTSKIDEELTKFFELAQAEIGAAAVSIALMKATSRAHGESLVDLLQIEEPSFLDSLSAYYIIDTQRFFRGHMDKKTAQKTLTLEEAELFFKFIIRTPFSLRFQRYWLGRLNTKRGNAWKICSVKSKVVLIANG